MLAEFVWESLSSLRNYVIVVVDVEWSFQLEAFLRWLGPI